MTITSFERNASILEMAVEMDRRGKIIEDLEARITALTASLSGQPEGWVLVPREPTERMIDEGVEASRRQSVSTIYRAMLSAAPSPASREVEG